MNIGIVLPGFSADENDWAIPVQLNLVREMARYEDVRVLTLRYPHRRHTYAVYGAQVSALGVGQVRGSKRLALWWEAIYALRRLHQEKPFDVLHAMWADETGLIAAWAGKWLGVPVVVSVAGGELVGLEDISYGLQRSRFSTWTVGQALHGADRVIVACTYVRRLIRETGYQIEASKIKSITLGVDTSLFRPADFNHQTTEKGSKTLIHVASLVGVKDQATLLRAVARLAGVSLEIVGTGPEQKRLETLAAELNIANRVRFVGSVPHLYLPKFYQRADLNVLSSRHEGLGMVTLEAGACGIPTVSTAVGLLPDCPEMGITVPVGDDEALANAVQSLLSDHEQLTALSRSAGEAVRSRYTIQNTVEQFRALYTELKR
jgi:glycosyltransferase involved in cell wall biosynthesis